MTGYKTLIDKSARMLTDMDYKQISSISDQVENKGITYTKWKKDDSETLTDGLFLVRAKEYVYENLASFGEEHVEDADRLGAWLVIYFDDEVEFYVFDAAHVLQNGSRSEGRSKRSDSRVWLEVDVGDGITLDEFETGEKPTSAGTAVEGSSTETKATSLFNYGDDQ